MLVSPRQQIRMEADSEFKPLRQLAKSSWIHKGSASVLVLDPFKFDNKAIGRVVAKINQHSIVRGTDVERTDPPGTRQTKTRRSKKQDQVLTLTVRFYSADQSEKSRVATTAVLEELDAQQLQRESQLAYANF